MSFYSFLPSIAFYQPAHFVLSEFFILVELSVIQSVGPYSGLAPSWLPTEYTLLKTAEEFAFRLDRLPEII